MGQLSYRCAQNVLTKIAFFTVQAKCLGALNLTYWFAIYINPRSLPEKIVTRSLEGGRVNRTPPPSTFNTIRPIDLNFGTYNKLHLYFQLSEATWCLIGFHGNNSQINDV